VALVPKRFTYAAGGVGRDTQVEPASLVRARATQDPAAHVESTPMTNPVVAETNVTDPGSKPLDTGDPAGTVGLGAVVVDGATEVVVVLVVVVRRGALVGDELHDAAQTARTSTAVTLGRRRRSGTSFIESIVTRRMPPEQGPKSLLRW
jgi:hypothetical protein